MNFDESFFVAFSIVIFFSLSFKYIKKPLSTMLTRKSLDIHNKILESKKLRDEAEDLLLEYKNLHINAVKEVDRLTKQLDKDIELMKQEAQKDLSQKLAIRKELTQEKITHLESYAIGSIRKKALRIALEAVVEIYQLEKFHNNNFANIITTLKTI
jgi:F-type H+-transporting ATPase subunit b